MKRTNPHYFDCLKLISTTEAEKLIAKGWIFSERRESSSSHHFWLQHPINTGPGTSKTLSPRVRSNLVKKGYIAIDNCL
jgi:hypothetical protein